MYSIPHDKYNTLIVDDGGHYKHYTTNKLQQK
jgi:hypothetical protein